MFSYTLNAGHAKSSLTALPISRYPFSFHPPLYLQCLLGFTFFSCLLKTSAGTNRLRADRADQFQSKRKPSGICSSETYRSNGGSQFQIFPYVFSSFPWHVSKLLCYAKFWVESWILTWITADILQQTQTKPLHRYITCYVSNSRCKTSKKKKGFVTPPPFRPPFFCFHLWLSHMQKLNILYKANTKLFCFQLNVQESPTTAVSNQIK